MAHRILLADDSLTIQKVVELTFSESQFELMTVGSGDKAVHALKDFRPDLVIADVVMPGLSGYEVCEAVKASPNPPPVILLTGTFEPFDRARAERVGCDSIVTKPFDSHALASLVVDVLEKYTQARAAAAAAPPPPPVQPPEPPPWAEAATTAFIPALPREALPKPPVAPPAAPEEVGDLYATSAFRIPPMEELAALEHEDAERSLAGARAVEPGLVAAAPQPAPELEAPFDEAFPAEPPLPPVVLMREDEPTIRLERPEALAVPAPSTPEPEPAPPPFVVQRAPTAGVEEPPVEVEIDTSAMDIEEAETAPIGTAPEPARVAEAEEAPVEVEAETAPIETVPEPAPAVEAVETPIEVEAAEAPFEAAEPAPIVEAEEAPLEMDSETAPILMEAEPAPAFEAEQQPIGIAALTPAEALPEEADVFGEATLDELAPAEPLPLPPAPVFSVSEEEEHVRSHDIEEDIAAFEAGGGVAPRREIWEQIEAMGRVEAETVVAAPPTRELEALASRVSLSDLIPRPAEPAPAVPAAAAGPVSLSDADVERIAQRVVAVLTERVVRELAWDIVPEIADRLVRARLRELEQVE